MEMGESLIYSWLKHYKKCQIVQQNWKVSDNWDKNIDNKYQKIIDEVQVKYDEPLFGKTNQISSIIKQAEIDLLGFNFDENEFYAVDVAFHTKGLNAQYGTEKVIKKILRTVLILDIYFDSNF